MLCYICRHFANTKLRKGLVFGERSFIDSGFSNWKDSTECFKKHEHCEPHKHAETMHANCVLIQSKQNNSIVTALSNVSNTEMKSNRYHVKISVACYQFSRSTKYHPGITMKKMIQLIRAIL